MKNENEQLPKFAKSINGVDDVFHQALDKVPVCVYLCLRLSVFVCLCLCVRVRICLSVCLKRAERIE